MKQIKKYADKSLSNDSTIDLLAGGSRITIHTLQSGSVFVTVYSRIEGKLRESECVKGEYYQSTDVSSGLGEEHRMVSVTVSSLEDPEITGKQDTTTDDYWDCECEYNYIHKKSDTLHCPKCNSREDEQPDSRVNEVEYLRDEEDAAERYFGSEAKVN